MSTTPKTTETSVHGRKIIPSRIVSQLDGVHSTESPSNTRIPTTLESTIPTRKKRHRAGRKHKKNRRQSFIAPSETIEDAQDLTERPTLLNTQRSSNAETSFYRLQSGNHSSTSLESEALLDHRGHDPIRPRRQSLLQSAGFSRPSKPFARSRNAATPPTYQRSRFGNGGETYTSRRQEDDEDEDDDLTTATDKTPLLGTSARTRQRPDLSRNSSGVNYGSHNGSRPRLPSNASSRRRVDIHSRTSNSAVENPDDYDVNNPPSMPASPKLGSLDDIRMPELAGNVPDRGRDTVITIDRDTEDETFPSLSPEGLRRRATLAHLAEMDVCFPQDAALSEAGADDESRHSNHEQGKRRRRGRQWPDFDILEEWSREEKEERTHQEHIRAKKIREPAMVGGRLRAAKTAWFREEEEAPFRFTYFNEVLDGTIHAQTISDLLQDGMTFRDLFLPEPHILDSSESEESDGLEEVRPQPQEAHPKIGERMTRQPSIALTQRSEVRSPSTGQSQAGHQTPSARPSQAPTPRPHGDRSSARYGPRPTFWLDVLRPTEMEMKVLSKAFGIHQLTAEDIMMEEQREKVELFSSYYFVNYRSFEQDSNNADYLEPVNIYVVVFRDGVITFHQSMTPHPANVRRRIRQLNDYMSPTADWISYAIIDDVTDVYAPLVQQIEDEVDEIDDEILYLHQGTADSGLSKDARTAVAKAKSISSPSIQADMGAQKSEGEKSAGESGGDMLRRVGECRKKVMGLYRLLGTKADVIKGFAKRCNEHWEVAPRSEIGLYLGDIQDHIVTMTGNLSHYENLLSRAHSNYLAQINIRMNERAEQTADVLGKLTVLGTIVLPMNIITGMWGMNVWVPGQDLEGDLTWFWCITAGLIAFGLTSYFVAKKVYGIV